MGKGGGILAPILNPVTDLLFGAIEEPDTPSAAEITKALKDGQGAIQQQAPEKDVKVVVGASAAKRRSSSASVTPTASAGLQIV